MQYHILMKIIDKNHASLVLSNLARKKRKKYIDMEPSISKPKAVFSKAFRRLPVEAKLFTRVLLDTNNPQTAFLKVFPEHANKPIETVKKKIASFYKKHDLANAISEALNYFDLSEFRIASRLDDLLSLPHQFPENHRAILKSIELILSLKGYLSTTPTTSTSTSNTSIAIFTKEERDDKIRHLMEYYGKQLPSPSIVEGVVVDTVDQHHEEKEKTQI